MKTLNKVVKKYRQGRLRHTIMTKDAKANAVKICLNTAIRMHRLQGM